MNWNDFRLRLRALFRRREMESDLADELQFHIEMQERKNAAAGMPRSEARLAAKKQFGGLPQIAEECRNRRGVTWFDELVLDIRYALRGFRRAPGFAVTVVATIALGLGLNTAAFTAFNAYVLQPIAVRDPQSLFRVTWLTRGGQDERTFTAPQLEAMRDQQAFTDLIGNETTVLRVEEHSLIGSLVTGNFFEALSVGPAMGRTIRPGDAPSPGRQAVMVLSHIAWTNKFGADPNIVGRKLLIRGYPFEVIGVAREELTGVTGVTEDFWIPLTMSAEIGVQESRIRILGHLRPGWSPKGAGAALMTWAEEQTAQEPAADRVARVVLLSESTKIPLEPEVLLAFSPLFAAFACILLIACSNVANMMLARGMARQHEVGVRLAIGAAPSRLIRQLLTECVLLALPAALAGFLVSKATIDLVMRAVLATAPSAVLDSVQIVPLNPDFRVLGFMLAAAVVSAVAFGLAPAIQATRLNVMQAARGEFTMDARPARLRNGLVIAQITLSVLFLVSAAISLRAKGRLQQIDPGLDLRGVTTMEIDETARAKTLQYLATDPSVEVIAASSKVPFQGVLPWMPVRAAASEQASNVGYVQVSPEYFTMFRLRILRGRSFTDDEATARAPVAIVSQATAARLWPGQDAVGQSFRITPDPARRYRSDMPRHATVRVIGVVPDTVTGPIGRGVDDTCIYFPAVQPANQRGSVMPGIGDLLMVRLKGEPRRAVRNLQTSLDAAVPGAAANLRAVADILEVQLYPYRAMYWIAAALGALALLLTLSGIYGVLSYLVAQRTKEIGIRVALGATAACVAGLVLRQSMRLAAAGSAIGALLAYATVRLAANTGDLYMYDYADVTAYLLATAVVVAAAAVAALLPSIRAARIEPTITLRHE